MQSRLSREVPARRWAREGSLTGPGGRMLGRYRLEELVGRGGMAAVWRAEDTKLGRAVAVKVILSDHVADRSFMERFLREARVVASLEHPNILPVYDFGEEGGLPFLVMPHLPGGTLRDRMTEGPLPLGKASDWIGQLASALDAAHEAGILHRDVKPANVLIGKGDRLFLADFGIAKMLETVTGLTATGVVVGTPLYMAPEQAQGTPASPATDRYALAVIAYELLAGKPPFEGENPLSLMHQHVTTPAPALSAKVRGIPAGLDAVFARALAKDPSERHSTSSAFAAAVAAFAPTGSAGAVPATAPVSKAPTVLGGSRPRPVATPPPGLTSEPTVYTGAGKARAKLAWGIAATFVAVSALAGSLFLLRGKEKAGEAESGVATPAALSPIGSSEDSSKTKEQETAGASVAVKASAPPAPDSPSKDSLNPPVSRLPLARGGVELAEEEPVRSAAKRLKPAFQRLDPSRKPEWRLSREDFSFAALAAQDALKNDPELPDARLLEIYARGGLSYVARDDGAASRALLEAYVAMKRMGHRDIRGLAFLLRRPGGWIVPPGGWELALAYGDARGEAEQLLDAALSTNPYDAKALLGRAHLRRLQGRTAGFLSDLKRAVTVNPSPQLRQGVLELLKNACRGGLPEACTESERLAAEGPAVKRRAPLEK